MVYFDERQQAWRPASEVKSFAVHANKKPWYFATMQEAIAASNDVARKSGVIVGITASFSKAPTHRHTGQESI